MNNSELSQYIPILIPSILGYGTAMFCNVGKDSGVIVKFRPPPAAFSTVWITLYILLGFSWYFARKDNMVNQQLVDNMYMLLNIMLCLWIYVYSCRKDKINGIYVLVLSIIFAAMCYTVSENMMSKLMIVPLMGWLLLATLLNIFEVEKE